MSDKASGSPIRGLNWRHWYESIHDEDAATERDLLSPESRDLFEFERHVLPGLLAGRPLEKKS